jgi:DNA-binding LacI/PurR family transcriptional regulator/GAF domain-containing protein
MVNGLGESMVIQERDGITWERTVDRPRGTLGILLNSLGDAYSTLLLDGLADYTQANDLNLGVVLMEGFANVEGALGEYALIPPERFDGIVLTGALAYRTERGADRLRSFRARYSNLPMVGILLELDQVLSVMADGYVGMRQAVEHLIDEHGYRRLAFIKGPSFSFVAQERYRAYVDVLADRDIPLSEDLVMPGDFTQESGEVGAQRLLERGVEIDALVCSNDEEAIGALEVLRARSIRVPQDIAVTGFDDAREAAQVAVPLTTVRQPLYEMGRRSGEILHRLIAGEDVDPGRAIPTELIIRRSCGCLPAVIVEAGRGHQDEEGNALAQPDSLAARMADLVGGSTGSDLLPLAEALFHDLGDPESSDFAQTLDQTLMGLQEEGGERSFAQWQEALTVVHQELLRPMEDLSRIRRLEALFQQARILVGRAENHWLAYQQMLVNQRGEALEWFQGQSASLTALEGLSSRFATVLPQLQLTACYLSTLINPGEHAQPEDQASLDLGCVVGESEVSGGVFPVNRWLPDEIWAARLASGSSVFSMIPMSVGEEDFGLSVFWGRPEDFGVCNQLQEAVTGIFQRAQLLEEQRAALNAAEEERRRADTALRDALVAQQRYVEQAWDAYAATIQGYQVSPSGQGPTDTDWIPGMRASVRDNRRVVKRAGDNQTLSLPLSLLGENVIGVLGFSREGSAAWTEEEIRMAESVAEQAALALENQRLVSDVQRRAARLTAASEVSSAATSITDLDALLSRVVELIRDQFDLYYAGIFLVDAAQEWAVLVAGSGEAGRLMLDQGHRLEVGGDSMIGYCVDTGNARITYDAKREERRRPHPLLPDTRSELALPLVSRGEVIGAMTIQDERPGAFTEDDITTLQTMAAQLANAIANARLLDQMEENLRELRAATGQYTREAWLAYLDRRSGTQGFRYRLVDMVSVADRRPEAETAWRQDRTVVTSLDSEVDPVGARTDPQDLITEVERGDSGGAGVGVPIRLRDQVLGVLNVRFEDDEVPEETVRLVEQVADRLALALESARLLSQMRRVAQRERMIGDVTDRMRRTLDWDDLMQTTTQDLREMLNASRVFVQWKPPQAGGATDDGAEDS